MTVTLWHDYENGSALWWDRAQEHATRQWWSVFAIVLNKLLRDALVEVTADEAGEFMAVAAELPGWTGHGGHDNYGAPFGEHPIAFEVSP